MKYRLAPGFPGSAAWHATTMDEVRRKPDQMNVSRSEWRTGNAIGLAIEGGGGFVARRKKQGVLTGPG